jgi:hypothetical protein
VADENETALRGAVFFLDVRQLAVAIEIVAEQQVLLSL